ncbi:hypothetical protein [Gilliamella apicola]|uniref:DUF1566 domain-containing protein n=1 Tax=Gilliamella apicola TaxID=1196095 RepID=A0A2V4DZ64_9GAMM|nr:hypothetical protein [Gilliamella apicola]PXZ06182.1 hypothetical protein DKK79_05840 [Gilliamella apicola]
MYCSHPPSICQTYNLNSLKLSLDSLLTYYHLFFQQTRQNFSKFVGLVFLSQQIVFALTMVVLLSISFFNHALTVKTTNIIQGSAPYLTFDGGQTRVTNTEALLGISLSDGRKFTPATPNSNDNPIELPVAGQSFLDIGMLVPANTDSIALSSLIGPPYNYWGDDDGDGQGVDGITATGSLSISIVDKNNQAVSRNTVLTICNAPYKLTLSNTEGTLKTRYGVPNESPFSASNVSYYINPKATPVICFAKPVVRYGTDDYAGPANIWDPDKGFLPQSVTPSSYGLNFPTTGAHNLYFDLDIGGNNQDLYWEPVSHGGITATMTSPTQTSVRVTLTGPAVTDDSQRNSDNPTRIDRLSLPQVFELVGRDSPGGRGNVIVKYGFVLKQWFVNRGTSFYTNSSTTSWCRKIGDYRLPEIKDLTNAICRYGSNTCKGATPSSSSAHYQRRIGAGFFTEWGLMRSYTGANFNSYSYWTSEVSHSDYNFTVYAPDGYVARNNTTEGGLCIYP